MQYKIEHYGIRVRDIENSVQWYQRNFGFSEVTGRRFEKPELGIKGALLQLGDFSFELLQPLQPYTKTTTETEVKEETKDKSLKTLLQTEKSHLALSVDDIQASYQQLKNNQVEKVEIVSEISKSGVFFCQDLDENLIEVRQRK